MRKLESSNKNLFSEISCCLRGAYGHWIKFAKAKIEGVKEFMCGSQGGAGDAMYPKYWPILLSTSLHCDMGINTTVDKEIIKPSGTNTVNVNIQILFMDFNHYVLCRLKQAILLSIAAFFFNTASAQNKKTNY